MRSRNYYDVLGVASGATSEEIRSSYYSRARVIHPDRFDQVTQAKEWQKANEMLAELNEAYAVLRNVSKRSEYDKQMGFGRPTPTSDAGAQLGHIVTAHFLGKFLDNPSASVIDTANVRIVLGGEGVVSDITNNLLGIKPGDTRTFIATYPLVFRERRLAGKRVRYTVTVTAVRKAETGSTRTADAPRQQARTTHAADHEQTAKSSTGKRGPSYLRFSNLPPAVKDRLLNRQRGNGEQLPWRTKTLRVELACIAGALMWLAILVYATNDYRWGGNQPILFGAMTIVSAFAVGIGASGLWRWKNSPMKGFIFLTPLYLIKVIIP